ncbi:MAG: hypothetical protein LBT94_05135 [Prevotellaceae bacterium]|nr:hypothetical protein [Prevotellaceae bacterium]
MVETLTWIYVGISVVSVALVVMAYIAKYYSRRDAPRSSQQPESGF